MIDPISAFAAVTTASSAISSAIKAGRDLSSLGGPNGPVAKYAKAEAELKFGAARKKNSIFSKMSGAEQAGIDEFFRQEELRQMRDEMRSIFMLYGKPGAWERLQAEIARQRQLQLEELRERGERRDKIIFWTVLPTIIVLGGLVLFFFIKFLQGFKAA